MPTWRASSDLVKDGRIRPIAICRDDISVDVVQLATSTLVVVRLAGDESVLR